MFAQICRHFGTTTNKIRSQFEAHKTEKTKSRPESNRKCPEDELFMTTKAGSDADLLPVLGRVYNGGSSFFFFFSRHPGDFSLLSINRPRISLCLSACKKGPRLFVSRRRKRDLFSLFSAAPKFSCKTSAGQEKKTQFEAPKSSKLIELSSVPLAVPVN